MKAIRIAAKELDEEALRTALARWVEQIEDGQTVASSEKLRIKHSPEVDI